MVLNSVSQHLTHKNISKQQMKHCQLDIKLFIHSEKENNFIVGFELGVTPWKAEHYTPTKYVNIGPVVIILFVGQLCVSTLRQQGYVTSVGLPYHRWPEHCMANLCWSWWILLCVVVVWPRVGAAVWASRGMLMSVQVQKYDSRLTPVSYFGMHKIYISPLAFNYVSDIKKCFLKSMLKTCKGQTIS